MESPLAQTWLMMGLLAIIFLVIEVGTWISDDQIAVSYSLVADPFVFILYLVLFLCGLVFLVTSFLRRGWIRKLLWLCSLAIAVSIFLLLFRLFGLDSDFHDKPVYREPDCLAWYVGLGRYFFREHWRRGLAILLLLTVQWLLDTGERLLRRALFIRDMRNSPLGARPEEERRTWRHDVGKVALGIIAGFAIFVFATINWVHIDHNQDATIGPCAYYGQPLVFTTYGPRIIIVHLLLDIAFWCCVAWLLLFLPDIWRYLRRIGRSNESPG